jgi:hypothetical protein
MSISEQEIAEMKRIIIELMMRSYISSIVTHTSFSYSTVTGHCDGEVIEWLAGFLDEHRLAFALRRHRGHTLLEAESGKLWEKALPYFAPAWYKTLELHRRYGRPGDFTPRQQAILDLLERKYQDVIKGPVEITIAIKRLRDLANDEEWQRLEEVE